MGAGQGHPARPGHPTGANVLSLLRPPSIEFARVALSGRYVTMASSAANEPVRAIRQEQAQLPRLGLPLLAVRWLEDSATLFS